MKYIILMYGSQRDYDAMAGDDRGTGWTAEDFQAMYAFMEKWNQDLVDSGEFVDARGLGAPAVTRRVTGMKDGVPVVTDGPYAETAEVIVGYTIVDCESFDRATEIAARVTLCPSPPGAEMNGAYIDVRPILEHGRADLEG